MKQRLLFVDDDPLILQGLRRSLHGMRAQWDLQFAGSGSDALALMAQQGASVPANARQTKGSGGVRMCETLFETT